MLSFVNSDAKTFLFSVCSGVVKFRLLVLPLFFNRVRPPAEKGEKTGWNLAV